jgi:signal transduction histidine kinase
MKARSAARLGWGLWLALVALAVGTELLERANGAPIVDAEGVALLVAFMAFGTVGAVLASRRPSNAIGWLFLGVGLGAMSTAFASEYALYGLFTRPGSLPGAVWVAWYQSWSWIPTMGLLFIFLFLLFPTGRLPSRRWRPVTWAGALALAGFALAGALGPRLGIGSGPATPEVANPLGLHGAPIALVEQVAGFVTLPVILLATASVFVRYRRADREERQQLKWFLYAVLVNVASLVVAENVELPGGDALFAVFISFFVVAVAVAVLKHRLYDIDLVINKTVVYGALAGFITAVYVGVVVGIGSLVGTGEEPNLAPSIAATALVAVLFQPVRAKVQRLANRLVYGRRAEPYEVLSRFSGRVAGVYAAEDALERMARVLGEGTGAASALVWLRVGEELRPAAAWPHGEETPAAPVPLSDGEMPPLPGTGGTYPVRHRGELLGALTVAKPPGDALKPAEDKLLSDLAAQAGLVLRNVRLTEELRARLEEVGRRAGELRASRRRIVAVQDTERRRLERDIHDGAQQHLVALTVNLNLAKSLARKDPGRAEEILVQLEAATRATLGNLRALARGIYPPLLAAEGLAEALRAEASAGAVPVDVRAGEVPRFPAEVEAAAYFCVLEALQNVAKYARASGATVRLSEEDGQLAFSVSDDGAGFDPSVTPRGSGLQNMADRLAALGGTVRVDSAPGRGTAVSGRIPARQREPVG